MTAIRGGDALEGVVEEEVKIDHEEVATQIFRRHARLTSCAGRIGPSSQPAWRRVGPSAVGVERAQVPREIRVTLGRRNDSGCGVEVAP